jgi:hypothetical protein
MTHERNPFITEKGFVKDAELKEYMISQIKPAVIEHFQTRLFKNKPELIEKNKSNIDAVVDELIETYGREIGLYEMYLGKTVFTADSIQFDITDTMFSEDLSHLKWIKE